MTAPHPSPLPSGGDGGGEGVLNLGDWNLFEIWCLQFGAFIRLSSLPLRQKLSKSADECNLGNFF